MTEKRFTTNGYKIYDTFHDGIHWLVNQVEAEEIVNKMNNLDLKARERSKALSKLQKENEQLKQFPIKLDNRIQKLEEDLKALKEMETDDLNPQAIEDVTIVIGMSLNALLEFRKELKGDVE